jgi:hypothetical protein
LIFEQKWFLIYTGCFQGELTSCDFFFERTAPESVCFIDIAEEKYKTTIMGDHRQEKKRNNNKKQDSPGWIGTSTRVTAEETRRPVGLGHQHGQPLHTTPTQETRNNRSFHPRAHMYRTEEAIRHR